MDWILLMTRKGKGKDYTVNWLSIACTGTNRIYVVKGQQTFEV
jgi:hypothetical protein